VKTELPRAERCETCRFFLYDDEGNEDKVGECHRFPRAVGPDSRSSGYGWEFPVLYVHDWCGEWRAKDGVEAVGRVELDIEQQLRRFGFSNQTADIVNRCAERLPDLVRVAVAAAGKIHSAGIHWDGRNWRRIPVAVEMLDQGCDLEHALRVAGISKNARVVRAVLAEYEAKRKAADGQA
jgi:hypothetical protein